MANGVDMNDVSTMPHGLPPSQVPPIYTAPLTMDGNRAYSTAGSTASMPTLAPSMYNYHHPQDTSNWSSINYIKCFAGNTHVTAQ